MYISIIIKIISKMKDGVVLIDHYRQFCPGIIFKVYIKNKFLQYQKFKK